MPCSPDRSSGATADSRHHGLSRKAVASTTHAKASSTKSPLINPNAAPSVRSTGLKPTDVTSRRHSDDTNPATNAAAIKTITKPIAVAIASFDAFIGSSDPAEAPHHRAHKKASTHPARESTSNTSPRHAPINKDSNSTNTITQSAAATGNATTASERLLVAKAF